MDGEAFFLGGKVYTELHLNVSLRHGSDVTQNENGSCTAACAETDCRTDTLSKTRPVALPALTWGSQSKAFCFDIDVRHGGLVRGSNMFIITRRQPCVSFQEEDAIRCQLFKTKTQSGVSFQKDAVGFSVRNSHCICTACSVAKHCATNLWHIADSFPKVPNMVAKATGKTVVDLLHSAHVLFIRCQEHLVDQTNFTQQQRLQTPRAELASFVGVEVQPRQQRWTRVPQGMFGDCDPHLLVALHDDFNATDVDVAGE